ncbi:MAG: urease accessory protein UreE [Gammaproteobacteria bacterium]|nr:MAG: urease accessory protein UreE [Gammaproteobacteria bacterium]
MIPENRYPAEELPQVSERIKTGEACHATLTLPFELRRKSRQRVRLDDGREIALLLPRGAVLRQDDVLRAADGLLIKVHAAPEEVSTAFTNNTLLLARAAYHLGNRHLALQIGHTWLRYLHDHVLDEMLREMGLSVFNEQAPFEPEGGAYEETHVHQHD